MKKRSNLSLLFFTIVNVCCFFSAHMCQSEDTSKKTIVLDACRENQTRTLYAPWRSLYTKDYDVELINNCIFCHRLPEESTYKLEEPFVIKRFKHCAVVINNYPYNQGHIMVIPFAHVRHMHDLSDEALLELTTVIAHAEKVLLRIFNCQGLNIGANIGLDSGASVPDHLHIHLLPRWKNDTTFLDALANTNIISIEINKIYDLLKEAFDDPTLPSQEG